MAPDGPWFGLSTDLTATLCPALLGSADSALLCSAASGYGASSCEPGSKLLTSDYIIYRSYMGYFLQGYGALLVALTVAHVG